MGLILADALDLVPSLLEEGLPAREVVTSPVAKTRSERKTFDGVKLSMSTEFPLSKQMMASVVDVIGVTSQKYGTSSRFAAGR